MSHLLSIKKNKKNKQTTAFDCGRNLLQIIFIHSYLYQGTVILFGQTTYSCAQNYSTPLAFPYDSIVNKSCNIECCAYKMLQIIQNIMLSQGLEFELSVFRRTTNNSAKVSPPWNKCTYLLKFSLDHCEIFCQYSQMC